jgi:uncharacterized cysteine cluster protein YcgN (CxxCxxCC family)
MVNKFWLNREIDDFSDSEWELLCDGCGKCCLEKLVDEDTEKVYTSAVCCRLLNIDTCKCNLYLTRFKNMPDCIKITPLMVKTVKWIPKTCSYRLIYEKKDLPNWHPLITGDKESTIKTKNSVKEFVVHPSFLKKDEDVEDYIIDDENI